MGGTTWDTTYNSIFELVGTEGHKTIIAWAQEAMNGHSIPANHSMR